MKRVSQRHLPVYVSQVSLAALLDLVLILLLAVILVVPLLRREKVIEKVPVTPDPGIKSSMPTAKVDLRIQPDQSILLDGKKVTGEQLLPELKKILSAKPDCGVLVHMPANFAAGSLARLMEEMHRVGVKHTAVEVLDGSQP